MPDRDITVSDQTTWKLQPMDNNRLLDELNFRPKCTIETAVRQYIDQVRELPTQTCAGGSPLINSSHDASRDRDTTSPSHR
jgi:hypothetical protein